jgi:hypothetical protein
MNWKESFKIHLIKMDKFFTYCKPPLKCDVKVYLAGYYARFLDEDYINQIKPFIIEDKEYFKILIKKHHQKLGQNAPIFYYAKINAEYKMYLILRQFSRYKKLYNYSLQYELSEPATLYLLASNYYRYSGKIYQALLFENIYKRIKEIFSILNQYTKSLELEMKNQSKTNNHFNISYEIITESEIENFKENLIKEYQENTITEKEIKEIKNQELNQILNNLFLKYKLN